MNDERWRIIRLAVFQVEACTKLFPAVFVKPTTSCMFQFEFGCIKVKHSLSWLLGSYLFFCFKICLAINLFLDVICCFFHPERHASVCWFASHPKVYYHSSLSSTDSGPTTQTSIMDKAAQPDSEGDGGSARCVQRMENPMLWGPASHEPTNSRWKQVMHTKNNHWNHNYYCISGFLNLNLLLSSVNPWLFWR